MRDHLAGIEARGITSNNGIAAELNRLGIPTPSGGGAKWYGTSVGNIRRRLAEMGWSAVPFLAGLPRLGRRAGPSSP